MVVRVDALDRVNKELVDNPNPSPEVLERLADELLKDTLKDRSRLKSARGEYPILSNRQIQRRLSREVPFSCLPKGAKVAFGLSVEEGE